jgi:hypothetical protein
VLEALGKINEMDLNFEFVSFRANQYSHHYETARTEHWPMLLLFS